MSDIQIIHVNRPEPVEDSIKILPRYGRRFLKREFKTVKEAVLWGLENCQAGFRVFHHYYYEWYGPDKILLATIENIEKEKV